MGRSVVWGPVVFWVFGHAASVVWRLVVRRLVMRHLVVRRLVMRRSVCVSTEEGWWA